MYFFTLNEQDMNNDDS